MGRKVYFYFLGMDEKMEETKELEKVKPEKATLFIHGKEREIRFNFSTWAKLEKEFGGLKNIDKLEKDIEEKPFSIIPHLMFIGLVDKSSFKDEEGNEVQITEENILDDYGLGDMKKITSVFRKALYGSLPIDDGKKVEMEAIL